MCACACACVRVYLGSASQPWPVDTQSFTMDNAEGWSSKQNLVAHIVCGLCVKVAMLFREERPWQRFIGST